MRELLPPEWFSPWARVKMERRERMVERRRAYEARPEIRDREAKRQAAYRLDPVKGKRMRDYQREYYAKKKASKLGP